MHRALIAIPLFLAAGCTQFPEVEEAVGKVDLDQAYPAISPLAEIDTAAAGQTLDAEFADNFAGEVDDLKRRGDLLRQREIE